jgi:hypothetical protein
MRLWLLFTLVVVVGCVKSTSPVEGSFAAAQGSCTDFPNAPALRCLISRTNDCANQFPADILGFNRCIKLIDPNYTCTANVPIDPHRTCQSTCWSANASSDLRSSSQNTDAYDVFIPLAASGISKHVSDCATCVTQMYTDCAGAHSTSGPNFGRCIQSENQCGWNPCKDKCVDGSWSFDFVGVSGQNNSNPAKEERNDAACQGKNWTFDVSKNSCGWLCYDNNPAIIKCTPNLSYPEVFFQCNSHGNLCVLDVPCSC